jgi:hypothetical protein
MHWVSSVFMRQQKEVKEDFTVEHFEFLIEQDGGPTKEITSTFETVQEWLHRISANETPNAADYCRLGRRYSVDNFGQII